MVAENQHRHIDQIKQTNAGAVYRLIDQLGQSRVSIFPVWRSWLLPVSLKLSREMLEAHLVQELENQRSEEPWPSGRWGWWLKLKHGTIFLCALVAGRFSYLRDLSSKLVVEESQELALKDDSPLLGSYHFPYRSVFIRHQKKLERLTSGAITLPGIIDTENGIVHRMPFYEDVTKRDAARRALEQHTGVPVYISMISAHGRWQRPCLVPHGGRAM